MSAWEGFNMMFYAALVFWTVPAAYWWLYFFVAAIDRVVKPRDSKQ